MRDYHAEERVLFKSGPRLHTIVIARIGKRGDFLPIKPCHHCARMAYKKGVKITTWEDWKC
jgi:hypothetical protein